MARVTRLVAPSFSISAVTWYFTVEGDRYTSRAICSVVRPSRISSRIFRSVGLSSSARSVLGRRSTRPAPTAPRE